MSNRPAIQPINLPPLHNSDKRIQPIRARHALVRYCLSEKIRAEYIQKKKLTVNRTNGTTKRKEIYQTERPDSYTSTKMIRLLDIYYRMRAFAGISSVIQQYKSQYNKMIDFCECSINKLKPALKELRRLEWIDMDEYTIRVHSEKHVYGVCGIDYNKKIDRTYYKPNKIKDETTSFYWLYVADIDDNRKRQAFMFHKTTMQTPESKLWVRSELSARGYNPDKADKDPLFLASRMDHVYRDSFHGQESEMHQFLVENRPDVNRGVKGMADAWNTCPQNVSYIKRQLILQHLAFVQKIGTISSPGWSHNKHCRVMYNFKTKETFQHFCDDIVPRQNFGPEELQRFAIPDSNNITA